MLQLDVDAVHFVQLELLPDEPLSLWCHVLEGIRDDALLLGHHPRTKRMQDYRTERVVDADALLQGDNIVPVAHGLLLASAD